MEMVLIWHPKFPFFGPKFGPKCYISVLTNEIAPKLKKTIYEWVSTNDWKTLKPRSYKNMDMVWIWHPKFPFFGPKLGPKWCISVLTTKNAHKLSKTIENYILMGFYKRLENFKTTVI